MGIPIHHSEAVVVLPPLIDGSVSDRRVRQWLARADLEICEAPQEMLPRVVAAVGQPASTDGIGALRFWGQTGGRPTVWMAAADPVHLEARLEHLRLQCLWPDERPEQALRQLFDELQSTLAADDSIGFVLIGASGYLRGDAAMPTIPVSAEVVNGCDPRDILPAGPAAARYHALLSEIQMTLHNCAINQQREELDLRTINSLWIWGGGLASEAVAREIPTLFADEAVIRGYWHSSTAGMEPWQESLERCAARCPGGFVAVVPDQAVSAEEHSETLTGHLRDLRQILKSSELRGLTLLFGHGLTARIRPRQVFRVWRRELPDFHASVTQ